MSSTEDKDYCPKCLSIGTRKKKVKDMPFCSAHNKQTMAAPAKAAAAKARQIARTAKRKVESDESYDTSIKVSTSLMKTMAERRHAVLQTTKKKEDEFNELYSYFDVPSVFDNRTFTQTQVEEEIKKVRKELESKLSDLQRLHSNLNNTFQELLAKYHFMVSQKGSGAQKTDMMDWIELNHLEDIMDPIINAFEGLGTGHHSLAVATSPSD
jgi:hypothetical protein